MENDKRKNEFRCIHRHNGYQHPKCYRDAFIEEEKIGFLDIETEDLRADFGVIFGYCIKDASSDKVYSDHLTLKDINKYKSCDREKDPREDTRVLEHLVSDMGNFNRLVGHYSCKFDLPYIRTRAVMCGVEFPEFGEYFQIDTWLILKKKFKLSRNSLENGCRKLLGVTNKDHLSLSIKHGVLRGEEWTIKDTMEHCRKDVLDTEALYKKIYGYAHTTRSSI